MYKLRMKGGKRHLQKNWALPERVFLACGACHVLAYAFLTTHPHCEFKPIWIRPKQGFTGNHILVVCGKLAFDYHGYSEWPVLLAHMKRKANRWWPGWDADLVALPEEVLISESKSKAFEGLWLREPTQFLFDALPRAKRFVARFPAPSEKRPEPPGCSERQECARVSSGEAPPAVTDPEL